MTLVLPGRLESKIRSHACEGAPEEVVGVLAGERDERSVVERVLRAENAAGDPEMRYEIEPVEELDLLERVDDAGLDVVGFYHSHPAGPSRPSPTDERLAAWVGYSYLVVSLAGPEPELGSWRWTGDAFEAESVTRP